MVGQDGDGGVDQGVTQQLGRRHICMAAQQQQVSTRLPPCSQFTSINRKQSWLMVLLAVLLLPRTV